MTLDQRAISHSLAVGSRVMSRRHASTSLVCMAREFYLKSPTPPGAALYYNTAKRHKLGVWRETPRA